MTDKLLPDYHAVRHILMSPSIAARTAPYVREDDFDWHGLLSETDAMSMGESVLVRIAYDLWESNGVVGVWELARRLDGRAFGRVVDALQIARGDQDPSAEGLHVAA